MNNTKPKTEWCRYPGHFQLDPIIGLIGLLVAFWFGPRGILESIRSKPALLTGTLILGGIFIIVFTVRYVITTGYHLDKYRIDGGYLEVLSPLQKKRMQVAIDDVAEVQHFRTSRGGPIHPHWRRGHVLIGSDGTRIRINEALPLWPEIDAALRSVPYRERTLPIAPWR